MQEGTAGARRAQRRGALRGGIGGGGSGEVKEGGEHRIRWEGRKEENRLLGWWENRGVCVFECVWMCCRRQKVKRVDMIKWSGRRLRVPSAIGRAIGCRGRLIDAAAFGVFQAGGYADRRNIPIRKVQDGAAGDSPIGDTGRIRDGAEGPDEEKRREEE